MNKGGSAAAVVTQRLLKNKEKLPKLHFMSYPWLQMVDYQLPSSIYLLNQIRRDAEYYSLNIFE